MEGAALMRGPEGAGASTAFLSTADNVASPTLAYVTGGGYSAIASRLFVKKTGAFGCEPQWRKENALLL